MSACTPGEYPVRPSAGSISGIAKTVNTAATAAIARPYHA
jgi:hypothetical protein